MLIQQNPMDKTKIYNLKQIEGACVLGSPVVAVILIFINYRNFGERQKGIAWIFIGIVWTLALFGIAMLIPENLHSATGVIFPALNGLILYPIINNLQGDKIKEHFNNNGERGSNWLIAGMIILVTSLILTPIILIDRISPINDYTRQAFDASGIYYNADMPIDEVNKLGGILKRIQYFNQDSPSEAVFIVSDRFYEFKLITEKTFFDNEDYLMEIRQIFKHVGRYDFKKTIINKITDPFLAYDKTIELVNYDSIPILLESVPFYQNPNFTLVYDISIEESERKKFQTFILGLDKIFFPQNKFDFLLDYEDNYYYLRLFIPQQNWKNPQLLNEVQFVKEKLNSYGFRYPFKLILVDNSTDEAFEKEF